MRFLSKRYYADGKLSYRRWGEEDLSRNKTQLNTILGDDDMTPRKNHGAKCSHAVYEPKTFELHSRCHPP